MLRRLAVVGVLFAILPQADVARAHGDLEEQIAALTIRIQRRPKDAELYLRRGELHRVHRDWRAAAADYDRAATLKPGLHLVDFCRGQMLLESGEPEAARRRLDLFLTRSPDRPDALLSRARALVRLREFRSAAVDFSRAISLASELRPEHYLEYALALSASGQEAHALHAMEAGLQRLGPVVTLELQALEFEAGLKRYDAALKRLDRLVENSERKEDWLVRRAALLESSGRVDAARADFAQALKLIEALPVRHRQTPATKSLECQVRASLQTRSAPADARAPEVAVPSVEVPVEIP